MTLSLEVPVARIGLPIINVHRSRSDCVPCVYHIVLHRIMETEWSLQWIAWRNLLSRIEFCYKRMSRPISRLRILPSASSNSLSSFTGWPRLWLVKPLIFRARESDPTSFGESNGFAIRYPIHGRPLRGSLGIVRYASAFDTLPSHSHNTMGIGSAATSDLVLGEVDPYP